MNNQNNQFLNKIPVYCEKVKANNKTYSIYKTLNWGFALTISLNGNTFKNITTDENGQQFLEYDVRYAGFKTNDKGYIVLQVIDK